MGQNILYIWGAGASAQALPTIDEMYERIEIFQRLVNIQAITVPPQSNNFLQLSEMYLHKMKKFRSFDTYAKSLFLKAKKSEIASGDYANIKHLLKTYIILEQTFSDADLHKAYWALVALNKNIKDSVLDKYLYLDSKRTKLKPNLKGKMDSRYESFLIDITDGDLEKILIFSWNYDTQLKMAINELDLHIESSRILKKEKKLNGSIEDSDINFGWEKKTKFSSEEIAFLNEVQEVVIIGYSFPFANRLMDEQYLKYFCDREIRSMDPVIFRIQTIDKDSFESCKERLISILSKINGYSTDEWDIRPIYNTKEFYIPAHY